MKPVLSVAPWLLVLIVGLPQLSETVYTPSLPDIASYLGVSGSWVEFSLTIYLLGFAVGTLFWGRLSDRLGRKPCLLAGLSIYIIGCAACYGSDSISWLLFGRFVQAFGGSTGSVLGQAICRDLFSGKELGKIYAKVSGALAFSPAIGPVLGGIIDQTFGWAPIFLLLAGLGAIVAALTLVKLPETHSAPNSPKTPILQIAKTLATDRHVLASGFLVAGANGILFSYYAEGSFYLIDLLGLSPSHYGFSFLGIALMAAIGSMASAKMQSKLEPNQIIGRGIGLILLSMSIFTAMTLALNRFNTDAIISMGLTLGCMMGSSLGIGMALPNILAQSLQSYRHAIGVASSLFGCYYYALISLMTFGMGLWHDGTLVPMPMYFLLIAVLMCFVCYGEKVTALRSCAASFWGILIPVRETKNECD